MKNESCSIVDGAGVEYVAGFDESPELGRRRKPPGGRIPDGWTFFKSMSHALWVGMPGCRRGKNGVWVIGMLPMKVPLDPTYSRGLTQLGVATRKEYALATAKAVKLGQPLPDHYPMATRDFNRLNYEQRVAAEGKRLSPEIYFQTFTPNDVRPLIRKNYKGAAQLAGVIDLTATDRYYDAKSWSPAKKDLGVWVVGGTRASRTLKPYAGPDLDNPGAENESLGDSATVSSDEGEENEGEENDGEGGEEGTVASDDGEGEEEEAESDTEGGQAEGDEQEENEQGETAQEGKEWDGEYVNGYNENYEGWRWGAEFTDPGETDDESEEASEGGVASGGGVAPPGGEERFWYHKFSCGGGELLDEARIEELWELWVATVVARGVFITFDTAASTFKPHPTDPRRVVSPVRQWRCAAFFMDLLQAGHTASTLPSRPLPLARSTRMSNTGLHSPHPRPGASAPQHTICSRPSASVNPLLPERPVKLTTTTNTSKLEDQSVAKPPPAEPKLPRLPVVVIHCTHGVNRTGYTMALITQRLGIRSASRFTKLFYDARGHGINKSVYLRWLNEQTFTPEERCAFVVL